MQPQVFHEAIVLSGRILAHLKYVVAVPEVSLAQADFSISHLLLERELIYSLLKWDQWSFSLEGVVGLPKVLKSELIVTLG